MLGTALAAFCFFLFFFLTGIQRHESALRICLISAELFLLRQTNKHSEKAPFKTECFDFPVRTNILTLATILNAS